METKPKSLLDLLNPFVWLAAIFGPLLRFLGLASPPQTGGFENIQKADVEDAAKTARESEEAIDAIIKQMSPAEVVKVYGAASPEDRATMDLSALDADGQNWLLNLSEDDLTLLAMSTIGGCARSLEARAMRPIYARPTADTETAEILKIPTAVDVEEENRREIAERFRQVQRELWLSPGIPALKPQHATFTLH